MAARRAAGKKAAAKGGINAKGGKRQVTSGRGRAIGGGAASGATGGATKGAFGIGMADHVPAHSFASSTMPRGTKKRQNPSTGPGEPDADDMPGGSKRNQTSPAATYDEGSEGAALAAPKKGMGFKAAAASAAKSAGVSPNAGAAIVAAASRNASPAAKKANPNLKKVLPKKKGGGGSK